MEKTARGRQEEVFMNLRPWLSLALALALCLPAVQAEPAPADEEGNRTTVLVGLQYGADALPGANLLNQVGRGYSFGYLDDSRTFCPLGDTGETAVSVVKTQNVYYGPDSSYGSGLQCYSDKITSDILVGCWHVLLPLTPATFEEAQTAAAEAGGFPAWINGEYQVRLGAYGTQTEAQAAAEAAGGTVVGTSAYGVSVVKTGTSQLLFQFDGDKDLSLTVMPKQGDGEKAVTYYKGSRYYGGFQYRRVDGGNLTVINVVDFEDYTECVISREMSSSWPIEALKAQAVASRCYYETRTNRHDPHGFDICSTTHCQVYFGMASTAESTARAVAETAYLRAWYDGEIAQTFYFSSDGGGTENVKNVWGSSIPYLCGVVDPYEATVSDKISYWDYTQTFTASQLNAIIQPYIQKKGYNCAAIVDFQITELTPTGNVKSISFTDANGKVWPFTQTNATDIARTYLGLKSIRYTVTKSGQGSGGGTYYTSDGGTLSTMSGAYAISGDGSVEALRGNPYVITGSGVQFLPAPSGGAGSAESGETVYTIRSYGWGHSVGMSQWGAYAMAKQGKTFDEILKFYYPGIEIY